MIYNTLYSQKAGYSIFIISISRLVFIIKCCSIVEKADVPIGIEFLQLVCLVLLDVKVFNIPNGTSDLGIR